MSEGNTYDKVVPQVLWAAWSAAIACFLVGLLNLVGAIDTPPPAVMLIAACGGAVGLAVLQIRRRRF